MYRAIIAAVAFIGWSTTTQAQLVTTANKPLSFGAALGAAIPINDLSDFVNTGYNATLILGFNTPSLPMNFRIEGAYNDFGYKQGSGSAQTTSVTGNAVFTFPTATPSSLRPYLIGGVGIYNDGSSRSGYSSTNDLGFNIGGGITIPLSGFNAFVEARYNRVATSGASRQFIPLVAGVMF